MASIFQNVSFTVEAGQVVALVGSSGGGKSTCVSLLQRFYEPTSGSATLDGKPLHLYDNKFFHNQVKRERGKLVHWIVLFQEKITPFGVKLITEFTILDVHCVPRASVIFRIH